MQFGDNLNEEADEEMDVSDNEDDLTCPRKKSRNERDAEMGILRVRIVSILITTNIYEYDTNTPEGLVNIQSLILESVSFGITVIFY